MRLLNVRTLRFQSFFSQDRPKYCILSHTWHGMETTFQECQSLFQSEGVRLYEKLTTISDGISKVLKFCVYARDHAFEWVWIDTCCINKDSSAELSEAINSMYKWYRDSALCVMHLADIIVGSIVPFEKSRWFTRGWTLQELLAPKHGVFVDYYWNQIGTRSELCGRISQTTGIPTSVLERLRPSMIFDQTIAARMSWAARRETTRPEDVAYCLLGIFDVNMSLLYGEGEKAFQRLQRKLVKQFPDESIFAWDCDMESDVEGDCCGLLATHPMAFEGTRVGHASGPYRTQNPPVTLSNTDIEFKVYNKHLEDLVNSWSTAECIVPLACHDANALMIGVPLVARRGRWFRSTNRTLVSWGPDYAPLQVLPAHIDSWQTLRIVASAPARIAAQNQFPVPSPMGRWRSPSPPFMKIKKIGIKNTGCVMIRFASQPCQPELLFAGMDIDQIASLANHLKGYQEVFVTISDPFLKTVLLVKIQLLQLRRWARLSQSANIYDQMNLVVKFPNRIDPDIHAVCLRICTRSMRIGRAFGSFEETDEKSLDLTPEQAEQRELIDWAMATDVDFVLSALENWKVMSGPLTEPTDVAERNGRTSPRP